MNNCNFAHAIVLITPVQFLLIANYNKKRFPLKHRSYIEYVDMTFRRHLGRFLNALRMFKLRPVSRRSSAC